MEPRTPTRRSSRSVRGVLYALALSLVALAGCGGEPPRPPEEAPAETLDAEREATEEVGRLGIRDAVGQMFVIGMSGKEPDFYIEKVVRERNIGGVLLFGYNMESQEQTRRLAGSLQELAMQTEPAVPLFIAVDHEGGEVQSAPWVPAQPSAEEVDGQADPQEARQPLAGCDGAPAR